MPEKIRNGIMPKAEETENDVYRNIRCPYE